MKTYPELADIRLMKRVAGSLHDRLLIRLLFCLGSSRPWKNLEEVKKQYGEIDPLKITLKEGIIEVNRREGYEIIYKHPPMKTREVVFLANGKAYTIKYSTTEDLYAASEEIFDHAINSFVIK